MDEPFLNESREFRGQWWLPDDPDNKVSGVLRYDPDSGLTLDLIGGWEYRETNELATGVEVLQGTLRWPMVHGASQNKYVTLLDTYVKSARSFDMARMFIGGPDELILGAQTALVGCLLESPDEAAFEAARATVENLTRWARHGGITWQLIDDESSGERTGKITSSHVPSLSAPMKSLTANLHMLRFMPREQFTRWGTAVGVRERDSFEFESETTHPLDYWLPLLSTVEDLISLSALRACALLTMRVYLPAKPEAWPDNHPMKDRRHEVQVYQHRILRPDPEAKAIGLEDFILTLGDIDFDKLIPRWMVVEEKYSAARSMILGLRYVTGGYLESKVVTAVAAAESMSRAMKPKPVMTASELRAVRAAVRAAVPAKWKTWVAERFTNAEPTLKDRLVQLAARPGSFMSELVPNAEAWAVSAANARNKLAHVGTSKHTADELFAVVEVTSAVVIMNFLHELGVPEERMKRALREHRRLSRACDLARSTFP